VYAHYTFLSEQIAAVEVERRTLLQTSADASIDKIRQLMQLKGIAINGAWLLQELRSRSYPLQSWQSRL
jgi:hypothetical protein